jgi:hypothetical protein
MFKLILRGNVIFSGCYTDNDCLPGYACNLIDGVCYMSGLCTGVVCNALDQCHNAGTCDFTTGLCNNPIKTNGTSCTDNNACTFNDTCQNGICTPGTAMICYSTSCKTSNGCQPETGLCAFTNIANNTSCGNGKICTNGTCGARIGSAACWKINTGAYPTGWCSDAVCTTCN